MWGRGGPGRISFKKIPLIPAQAGISPSGIEPPETPACAGVSGGLRRWELGPGFRRDDREEGWGCRG